jgi:voltage-gated potassium channel
MTDAVAPGTPVTPTDSTPELVDEPARSNAYNIFMLVLTVMSLTIMALLLLPLLTPAERGLMLVYDNIICVVFLIDFGLNLRRAKPKSDYFIRRRGWLDLIGSIPTFGFFQIGALLRLARLSRLARSMRILRGKNQKALVEDILANRGQYALFITVLAAFVVLVSSSLLVVQFESDAPGANITTGGDGLWWAIVTITTVGYGDKFPITVGGRMTATYVMFAGVGIIGALASILASILVPQPKAPDETPVEAEISKTVESELVALRQELAALRQSLAGDRAEPAGPSA